MELVSEEILKKYKKNHLESYDLLQIGLSKVRQLIDHNFDSYIFGSAVRNLYLCKELKNGLEIATSASLEDLTKIFKGLKHTMGNPFVTEGDFKFYFVSLKDGKYAIPRKYKDCFYDKKLIKLLLDNKFISESLVLTKNNQILDFFNAKKDLDNKVLDTIEKYKSIFDDNPSLILTGLSIASELDFRIEKKTLKLMSKASEALSKVERQKLLRAIRYITCDCFNDNVIKLVCKSSIFDFDKDIESYIKKIATTKLELSNNQKATLLYLMIGSIPDACFLSKNNLTIITENMSITNLICQQAVTPMLVYNFGAQKLIECDQIARCYKSSYKSQCKLIKKQERNLVIKSSREMDFTSLELIMMLNGERSIKIKIIMNLLLEKVINKEIPNYNVVLKEEASNLINKLSEIYDFDDSKVPSSYTDEEIKKLHEKYLKEFEFLVKVYLNDEKELYAYTALEREEIKNEAREHAKEFLTETNQYKILIERGLI